MRSRVLFLGVLCVTLLGGACADFRRGPAADACVKAPEDDPVFETDVYPILQVRCQDCHSKGREAQSSRFLMSGNAKEDRSLVVMLVSPADPNNSLLLLRGTGIDHTGGQRLFPDDPEYATIRDWIASLPSATCP